MEKQLKIWQLKDNPFLPLPPQNEEMRHEVFVGRKSEIENILFRAKRPQGLFIFGMFGIGKSMLSLEVLRLLKKSHKVFYVKFRKSIGLASSILTSMNKPTTTDYEPMINLERSLIKFYSKKPVVIVIDDLDKDTDIGDMQRIIFESRQIIELGCLVILLGHPFGITAELNSSHDILYPIPLSNLSQDELVEMMKKYLATSRMGKYTGDPLSPFTADVANILSSTISEKNLTPRILNQACRLLLDQAAMDEIESIDKNFLLNKWSFIARSCLDSLREEDREYYRKIQEAGKLSEDTRPLIKEIGGGFSEYAEVRKTIDQLIQENILIEENADGKKVIRPNPLFDEGTIWR